MQPVVAVVLVIVLVIVVIVVRKLPASLGAEEVEVVGGGGRGVMVRDGVREEGCQRKGGYLGNHENHGLVLLMYLQVYLQVQARVMLKNHRHL